MKKLNLFWIIVLVLIILLVSIIVILVEAEANKRETFNNPSPPNYTSPTDSSILEPLPFKKTLYFDARNQYFKELFY